MIFVLDSRGGQVAFGVDSKVNKKTDAKAPVGTTGSET